MYRTGRIFWPLVLIAVGVLLLAGQLSNGAFDAGAFIGRWWPILLVGLGLAILLETAWPRRSARRRSGRGRPCRCVVRRHPD